MAGRGGRGRGAASSSADPSPRVVAAARRGDPAAQRVLYDAYHSMVWACCISMLRRTDQAEDAAQDAWVRIFLGLGRFRGSSRFSTWAYRVAMNVCLNRLRRPARSQEPAGEHSSGADPAALGADVGEALARLPVRLRACLVMRSIAGLSYAEIARALGMPVGTVWLRISQARQLLRELIG